MWNGWRYERMAAVAHSVRRQLGPGAPGYLADAGYLDREAVDPLWRVRLMTDADLLACYGIGPAMLRCIRQAITAPAVTEGVA